MKDRLHHEILDRSYLRRFNVDAIETLDNRYNTSRIILPNFPVGQWPAIVQRPLLDVRPTSGA
jgi:hypothetical protein